MQVNPQIIEIYNYAKQMKKQIIFLSDNYLSGRFIDEILKSKGISGYRRTFVSSDYREGKWNGRLFEIALKEMGFKSN